MHNKLKIAACDYDGTLFRHGQVSRDDMEAIIDWRAQGHLFGIVTGRDLNMMRGETKKHQIPFDFMICNTGASIFDADYTPLNLTSLPPSSAADLLDHPASRASRYFLLSRAGKTFINMWATESWLTGLGLDLQPIAEPEARRMTGVQQIGLEFDTPDEARRAVECFGRDFAKTMQAHQSGICVDLVAAGVDKAEGLALLIDMQGWRPEKVLTFGDSENDLPMLRRYHGYAMDDSSDEVKQAAKAVIKSPSMALRCEF